jgi:CHASE2 domain-containing sensor protein/signal transduction histidine kinase
LRTQLDERWLTALILAAVALIASLSGALGRFDNLLYDLGERATVRAAPDDIVIVAIDQDSLIQLGRWPWSRSIHAALVERLHREGARVIALDMVFAEPDASGQIGDAQLADAIAKAGNVVLPLIIEQSRLNGEMREVGPLPQLAESAAAIGRVHVEIEDDGIVRGLYLREGLGSAHWPHFTEVINNLLSGKPTVAGDADQQNISPYKLVREDYRRIPFLGIAGHFQTLSYIQALTGNYSEGLFRNKVVLVGATAAGLGDHLPTPVSGLAEGMPGVEVNANALEAFRHNNFIRPMSGWTVVFMTVLLSLAPVPVLARLSPRAGLLASLLMLVVIALLAMAVLLVSGYWFPPASALLAILVAYPVWSWRRLEAAGRYLDRELQDLRQDLQHSAVGTPDMPEVAQDGDPFQARIVHIQMASERLRIMRHLIDQVLEGMPHGVVALDAAGRAQLVNRRAQNWLGLKKGTPPPIELNYPGQPEAIPASPHVARHEIKSRDGVPLLVDEAAVSSGTGIVQVINLMDISEIKKLEAERRETLAFLSHDIRAPLAMALEQINASPLSPETLLRLREQLARSYELAEEFLATSRAEIADSGQFQEIEFCGLLHQAVDAVYAMAQARQVVLHRSIPDEPVWINGAFGLLERMAFNLVQNAVKYSPAGETVNISLTVQAGAMHFCVEDKGPGIPGEHVPNLFQRFSRLEGQHQAGIAGAGLGLYFVRVVAEKHGGSVGVESVPGAGARFCVMLPVLG